MDLPKVVYFSSVHPPFEKGDGSRLHHVILLNKEVTRGKKEVTITDRSYHDQHNGAVLH